MKKETLFAYKKRKKLTKKRNIHTYMLYDKKERKKRNLYTVVP